MLRDLLQDDHSLSARVYTQYIRLLRIRAQHPAFHPDGEQTIFDIGDQLFAFQRISPDQDEAILVISNFSDQDMAFPLKGLGLLSENVTVILDLISEEDVDISQGCIKLAPYQSVWLLVSDACSSTPIP